MRRRCRRRRNVCLFKRPNDVLVQRRFVKDLVARLCFLLRLCGDVAQREHVRKVLPLEQALEVLVLQVCQHLVFAVCGLSVLRSGCC